MTKRTQAFCLLGPLLLVEATAYWKIAAFLSWGTEGILAFSSGLAFVSLLLGGIVALSQDIPHSMRRSIFLGGLLLFGVQGLANILVTYQYAMVGLPIEVPMQLFKIDYDTALTSTAVVQGLTLSLVSIAFWQVIATMLSQHLEEVKNRKTSLSKLNAYLEEVIA
jgi:hypothetical protein